MPGILALAAVALLAAVLFAPRCLGARRARRPAPPVPPAPAPVGRARSAPAAVRPLGEATRPFAYDNGVIIAPPEKS